MNHQSSIIHPKILWGRKSFGIFGHFRTRKKVFWQFLDSPKFRESNCFLPWRHCLIWYDFTKYQKL